MTPFVLFHRLALLSFPLSLLSICLHHLPSPLPSPPSLVCLLTVVCCLTPRACPPILPPTGSQEMATMSCVPDATKRCTVAGFPWLLDLHYMEECKLLHSLVFQLLSLFLAVDLVCSSGTSYPPLFSPAYGCRLPVFSP